MKLRKSSWFIRYYTWMFEKEPETNCGLFWGLVYAVLLFPISIPGRIFRYVFDDAPIFIDGFLFYFANLVLYLIGYGMNSQYFHWNVIVLILYFMGIGAVILGFGILALILYGGAMFAIWIDKRTTASKMKRAISVENKPHWLAAMKLKYCLKIEWIDEESEKRLQDEAAEIQNKLKGYR